MSWRLGVVGSPIAHSLSPALHRAGLAGLGLEGESRAYEATTANEVASLFDDGLDAVSVTAPLKGEVLSICDELDDVARRTESVNSILRRDGRLLGRSTDGPGFVDALVHEMHVSPEGQHVVVLGAGGAARAVVDALVAAGVSSVVVHGSDPARVAALVARHAVVYEHSFVYRPVDLVVNTVPVGVRREDAAVLQGVGPHTTAVDLAYDPSVTAWMELYRAAGAHVANGLGMLVHQAARQMTWWFDAAVSADDLWGAVR